VQFVAQGGMLLKHIKEGRGKPHPRWFVVYPEEIAIAWGPAPGAKGMEKWKIIGMSDGPSYRVAEKNIPHAFTVTVANPKGGSRELDLIADDAMLHDKWTRGLRVLLSPAKTVPA